MRVAEVAATGDVTAARLLQLAGAAAAASDHPVSRAIAAHARAAGPLPAAIDARTLPGRGAEAKVDGHTILVGRGTRPAARRAGWHRRQRDVRRQRRSARSG